MEKPDKYTCLEALVQNYFDMCDMQNSENSKKISKPYSMSGFLYHTGLDRDEFERLKTDKKYGRILKEAQAKIQAFIEEKSLTGELSINASQGSLKYYFGWGEKEERHDEERSGDVRVVLSDEAKELAK